MRCRCGRHRRRCCCGHRCAGGVRQWRRATVATSEWQCGVRWLAVANGPNIFKMLFVMKTESLMAVFSQFIVFHRQLKLLFLYYYHCVSYCCYCYYVGWCCVSKVTTGSHRVLLLLHFAGMLLPTLLLFSLIYAALLMFVPIMGRTGTASYPDLLMGCIVVFSVIVLSAWQVTQDTINS